MKINAKKKGAEGEREFCRWIQKNLELDFLPERNLDQVRNGGADILGVYPFVFEIKRVENLDLVSAWIQCKTAAEKEKGEPVVAFRKNRNAWSFMISASYIGCSRGFLILQEREFIEWALEKLGKPGLFANYNA